MGIRTKLNPLGKSTGIITSSNLYPFTEFIVGVTTISITDGGWFRVYVVGGGGTGGSGLNSLAVGAYWSGGSGAGFVGEIYLSAGNHTITVGNVCESSSIDNLIIAGGGGNGSGGGFNLQPTGGAGGAISVTGSTQNVQIQANGNAGAGVTGGFSHIPGGASVYNGWGAGGASNGSPSRGYVAIQQVTKDQVGEN